MTTAGSARWTQETSSSAGAYQANESHLWGGDRKRKSADSGSSGADPESPAAAGPQRYYSSRPLQTGPSFQPTLRGPPVLPSFTSADGAWGAPPPMRRPLPAAAAAAPPSVSLRPAGRRRKPDHSRPELQVARPARTLKPTARAMEAGLWLATAPPAAALRRPADPPRTAAALPRRDAATAFAPTLAAPVSAQMSLVRPAVGAAASAPAREALPLPPHLEGGAAAAQPAAGFEAVWVLPELPQEASGAAAKEGVWSLNPAIPPFPCGASSDQETSSFQPTPDSQ